MYYYSPSPESQISVPSNRAPSSGAAAAASVTGFFVPGKRKRSNRDDIDHYRFELSYFQH